MKKFFLYISLISCFTYAQIPSNIPTDGLYGYWPLDGNVNDLSGNENHGTTDGNYSFDTHENGEKSVYLQNQMIVLPSSNDLNVDNFTVQFWTKAVSYNIHNKVQFGEINSNSRWVLNWADSISPLWNSSLLYYWPSACTTYADFNNSVFETSIDRDVWHLLTFVVEGQSTSFYRNGDLITTLSGASNLTCFNDNMNIYFGGDIGGGAIEYYNGWFDNIAIWTRALNSEEIESIHYSSTSGCDYQGNFLDQDGNQNQYINYGDLDWSVSEVSVTTYRDGTPIPLIVDESEWGSQSTGAYCYVNNDPNNNILYNYYAIIGKHDNDPNTPNKNLAPEGWRMPSDADWNNLTEFISNTDYVSDGNIAMAMASTSGWTNSSNSGAPGFMQSENNSSCFNAHPNGTRGVGAGFNQQGETSEFWSTDELTHYINFAINTFINTNNNPGNGKSARFVRDFEDNCTSDGTFIDQENNVYDYINYGTQSWSVLNAATEIYRDGTPIPQITNLSDWINLTTGAWTYFENDPTKGKLYNWYAVAGIHDNDPTTPNKQFAPEGWRVPNKEDWIILQNYLVDNGFNYDNSLAGNKIAKAMASKSGWIISENIGDAGNQQNSNNSSCFNAIPYGMVSDSYNFTNEGSSAIFWTSENLNSSSSYYRDINSNASSLGAGSDFNPPNGLTIASNRGCSVRLVKDLGCTTSTPTGDVEQTFCDTAIVADLTATGDSIQWYDAATGGNLLESTTTLTDGQLVYASQTVNGCESTDRLEVTVSVQDITITASATEVCAGESVDLSVVGDFNSTYLWSTGESNFSGQGTLVDEYSLIANTVSQNTFSTIPGNTYRLEVSGAISLGGGAGNKRDVAYYTQSGPDGTTEGTPFDSACNLRIWTSLFCDTPGLRPSPDIYDASTHTYSYPFTANSSTLDVGFWDSPLGDNAPNMVTFKLYELSNSESTITVTPIETTEYWVDVTTNGVTCREYITISIQDNQISASNTEVCSGESVDLTVSSGLTAGTTACTSAELPANLQTGLVGYWPFCGNANDESGNGNNGTVNGAILTSDRFGENDNAYLFDGINDWVSLNGPIQDMANFTISAWVYHTGESYSGIFSDANGVPGEDVFFNMSPSEVGVHADKQSTNLKSLVIPGPLSGPSAFVTSQDFNGQWQNILWTLSPTESKIYINGINVAVIDATGSNIGNHASNPSIGRLTDNFTSEFYPTQYFTGKLDDFIIWSRTLSESEIQQLTNFSSYTWSTGETTANIAVTPTETTEYWVDVTTNGVTCREYVTINVTTPAAPTGDSSQSFCDSATVLDLTATGDNIQWYDAATGGNLLESTTTLTDGQLVYASQTVNGCESTDRLEVTVSVQDITITASATEVCAGESVDLSVVGDINSTYLWSTGESNFSGQGTLVDEYSLTANTVSQNTFSTIPGNIYRLEVSGTISLGGGAGNQRDVAYYIQSGSDGTIEGTPFDSACNLRIWTSLFCDTPGLRPSPDIYDASTHTYNYPFNANSSTLDVGFWDSPLSDNGPNVVTFKLYELSNSESTITVSPTETTEYWVDVTTNGVTCREYITINVTAPAAPTGSSVQGGCSDFTLGSNNNTFTGENLQWYAAPSGGTALPDSHLLADGTYYYISQTIDGCESSDRFEFLYLAPDPIITIDTPIICEGDSTTVSISSSPSFGTATFLWNTGETSESINLSPTESTTFWVDQIYNSGGPENIQTVCRYFFGITVDNAPDAPISGGDISECETVAAQTLIAIASAEAGESITWYNTPTGGSLVTDPSLSNAGTVTYYAEATNDTSGCSSLTRTAVTLTITSVAAPTGDAVQSFCDNVTVSDLLATGSNIQWYDAATGGNGLDPSSALSDGQLIYASQTQNGCESLNRLEVNVEIDIIPDPILINTELEFCLAREATLADLELDDQGFALEWYDSFNGGNMLPMDTLLEDGVSYYATLYDPLSGCESLMRLEVVLTVIPCEVIIYNALSLNDNGQNDYMVIENAEYFPDNSLEVYNRDGHLVYSQTQYGVDDNLFRGVANVGNIYGNGTVYSASSPNLPTGSYLYIFKYFNPYEQQQYTLKGFLTINSN